MAAVEIISYTPELQSRFEQINKEWVEQYFTLEPFDREQLERPDEQIIAKGGAILFARENDEIIGTVGLVKTQEEGVYELIKMGVLPKARGKKIGLRLVEAMLVKAKEMGGKKVVLYSSSKLAAALHIYQQAGFVTLQPECGKYERCDVKMEKLL
jgi:N-acetylglutamate synthase-like GNAT family acetyltransferase